MSKVPEKLIKSEEHYFDVVNLQKLNAMHTLGDSNFGSALPLFYQPEIAENQHTFTPEESGHIAKVLRLQVGHQIQITDGNGKIHLCQLTAVSAKKCTADVLDHLCVPQKKHTIHIAIAPTKNMNRLEWFVEKSIEIGVQELSFIYCRHSERQSINLERLQKKAASALKQSQQAWLPTFNPMVSFVDVLTTPSTHKLIAHSQDASTPSLKDLVTPNSSYIILIGPEGGFTEEEIDKAKKREFQCVHLGKNRLRTETAGIVACQTLNAVNEAF